MTSAYLRKTLGGLQSVSLATISAVGLGSLYYAAFVLQNDSAVSMWMLGLFFLLSDFSKISAGIERSFKCKTLAFILLSLAYLPAYFKCQTIAVFIASTSVMLFFCGYAVVRRVLLPFAIWILGVSYFEEIHTLLSFPLRILGVRAAEIILCPTGYEAEFAGASIFSAGREVVITAACSGIDHLWVMVLFCWVFASLFIRDRPLRIVYFLLGLPVFIFSNAVRIALTVIILQESPDMFDSETVHTALGVGTIVLAMAMFAGIEPVLKKLEERG